MALSTVEVYVISFTLFNQPGVIIVINYHLLLGIQWVQCTCKIDVILQPLLIFYCFYSCFFTGFVIELESL